MRFSLSLSIAILAVFASVQAKQPEVQEGTAEVQGKGEPQSRLSVPECLGEHGEVIQECLDGVGSDDPEVLDREE
ncbi:predicted protein [Lichtheimia corymbifera JMRC:FSU:9682]|uniref:Uncharacterized protein n=1 Tax=Lichtheimia corymbifera JMRC:FSU:9682 TaxID=1263082 RepID=A0A068RKK0_9FUNG|nr:predicted protein [Lichtheimia corymbifera JMRC:FSU:9682]